MKEVTRFSGKVKLCSLPTLSPGGPELPKLKRLALPQGELAQFHDSDVPVHYIAALELVTHSVRGNHYHHTKVEYAYLMRGAVELTFQDMASGERATLEMRAGDLVVIQPGVAHAYRTVEPGVGIEFAPTRFDLEDIHRVQLV